MDRLQSLIDSLTPKEKILFKDFVAQHGKKKERKDVRLFELLAKDKLPDRSEILLDLYGDLEVKSKNALSTLRKRLIKVFERFLVLRRIETDNTQMASILGNISLAKMLFNKHQAEVAWVYLREAEEMASNSNNTELLSLVQTVQMENAQQLSLEEINTLILEKQKNLATIKDESRYLMVWSLLTKRIQQYQKIGIVFPLEELNTILKDYQMEEMISSNPRILFGMADLLRKVAFTSRDFNGFESMISGHFKKMMANHTFDQKTLFYKLNLIYMMAHVKYRKRDFTEALELIDQLDSEILKHDKRYLKLFSQRPILLRALIYAYNGKLEDALLITQKLSKKRHEPEFESALIIYRSVFLFCNKQFSAANKLLLRFPFSDQWGRKAFGAEFLLKFKLMHLIIQLELGHIDLAMNKIKNIRREFKKELNNPFFTNAKDLLKYIDGYIDNPEFLTPQNKRLQLKFEGNPGWQNDVQSIAYYSWIQSKLYRKEYYECLVENMKNNE